MSEARPPAGITDLPGVRIGHATDSEGGTGCTVVLFDRPALAAIDVGGGSASTRQTDSLRPGVRAGEVHGILLTGGSSFGHAAADGCMRFLEEQGIGFPASVARIPRVPSAVLFDLSVGSMARRPDAAMGRAACAAASAGPVVEGNVGAGAGCSVAKRLGPAGAWKGGIGTAAARMGGQGDDRSGSAGAAVGGYFVGAIAAVNAIGDIHDPHDGRPIAVARGKGTWTRPPPAPETNEPGMRPASVSLSGSASREGEGENTTLVVVATDAPFDRNQLAHLARMAQDGLALAVRPAHTPFDGDVVFAVSTADRAAPRADDLLLAELGDLAMRVVADAIVRGVRAAEPLHGLPAVGR